MVVGFGCLQPIDPSHDRMTPLNEVAYGFGVVVAADVLAMESRDDRSYAYCYCLSSLLGMPILGAAIR